MAERNRKFSQAQMLVTLGRLIRSHASIVSGHYKSRKIYRKQEGTADLEVELSDEEKLSLEFGTMDNHIKFLEESAEFIYHDYLDEEEPGIGYPEVF